MRTSVRLLPLVAMTVVALLLAGCTEDRSSDASRTQDADGPTRRLGGRVPEHRPPPRRAMNELEQQVLDQLSPQVAREGLTLDYLDCPRWDHVVPSVMTCDGYAEGLVAAVRVHVKAWRSPSPVVFDARLSEGVIATRALEETLVRQGWTHPECGDVAAYPALASSRIICRVHRSGRVRHVVATVTGRSGRVLIADYGDVAADR